MTNRIGDRPQFPLSNQRFDKGDAENIARYYEEIISRFTGSIYGQAWGCMSNPAFYMQSTVVGSHTFNYIKVSKCALLYSVPADNTLNTVSQDMGPWNAAIVQYDPARAGQPLQTLTTNTAYTAGQRPWILFRRQETATNAGNKAYWNTSTNTEDIGAEPLQRSEYVEFKLSTTYSANDRAAGWYRCAYIDSWGSPGSAATPLIKPIHWMDSQYYKDDVPPPTAMPVASALVPANNLAAAGSFGFNPLTEMPELAKLMHWMAGKLGQHYSSESTLQVTEANQATFGLKPGAFVSNLTADGGWLATPPRGLVELHTGLQELEDTLVPTIQAAVNALRDDLRRTTRLLHTLYVTPVGTESMDWTDVTFNVVQCSATDNSNSLSPTLRPVNVSIPLESYELTYQFVPLVTTGRKTLLNLSAGTDFVLTSVNITANDTVNISLLSRPSLTVTQNYMTPIPGIAPPPSNYLQVQFVIDSGNGEGSDEMRPFTVHIYGRNV